MNYHLKDKQQKAGSCSIRTVQQPLNRLFNGWCLFLIFCVVLYSPMITLAQWGPVHAIDVPSSASPYIGQIITADLDNNGRLDVILANGQFDHGLTYYLNLEPELFSEPIVIDSSGLFAAMGVASGDFNNDGWVDLVTITHATGELVVYYNDNDLGFERLSIDSALTVGKQVMVADFDGDGFADIIALSEGSISWYRNMEGNGFLEQSLFQAASTSDWHKARYLDVADINQDGSPDFVASRANQLVLYLNDGEGNFTETELNNAPVPIYLLRIADMNVDGNPDVLVCENFGDMYVFLGNGLGSLEYEGVVLDNSGSYISSLHVLPIFGEGPVDIYLSYSYEGTGDGLIYWSEGELDFAGGMIPVFENWSFIHQTAVADLTNNGVPELIFGGYDPRLAYRAITGWDTGMAQQELEFRVYPNPATDYIRIEKSDVVCLDVKITDLSGRTLFNELVCEDTELDISDFAAGTYCVNAQRMDHKPVKGTVFIKH